MKKFFITSSILLSCFYLSFAIDLELSSGDKLDLSSWENTNNITSKINLDNNNLDVNGKLVSSGKICAGEVCLGEYGKVSNNPGLSCKDILAIDSSNQDQDGLYYIKPTGLSESVQAYCDMTTNGGGRTKWYENDTVYAKLSYANSCINDGYYKNTDYFCIKPDLFGTPVDKPLTGNNKLYSIEGVEYMMIKGTDKRFPTGNIGENYNRASDGTVSGRGVSGHSCREYKKDGYSGKSVKRFDGTYGVYIIDCYIR